jgi:hypothetical protein
MGWISVRAPSHPYGSTITRLRSERLQRRTGPLLGAGSSLSGMARLRGVRQFPLASVRWPGWSSRSASQIAPTHNDRSEADQPRGRACCNVGLGGEISPRASGDPREPSGVRHGFGSGASTNICPGRLLLGDRGDARVPRDKSGVGEPRAGCGCKSCRAAPTPLRA